jgi:hypothetical protein
MVAIRNELQTSELFAAFVVEEDTADVAHLVGAQRFGRPVRGQHASRGRRDQPLQRVRRTHAPLQLDHPADCDDAVAAQLFLR